MTTTLKLIKYICLCFGLVILSRPFALFAIPPEIILTPQEKPQDGLKIEATIFNNQVVDPTATAKKDTLLQDLQVEKEEVRALAMAYLKDKKKEYPTLSPVQKEMFEQGFDRCTKAIEEKLSEALNKKQTLLDKRNLLKKNLLLDKAKAALYFSKWLTLNKALYSAAEWEKIDAELLSPLRLDYQNINADQMDLKQFDKTFKALQALSPANEINKVARYDDLIKRLFQKGNKIDAMPSEQLARFPFLEVDKKFLSDNFLQKGPETKLLYKFLVEELKKLEIDKEMINKETLLKEKKSLIEKKQSELAIFREEFKKTQTEIDELNKKLKEVGLGEEDKTKFSDELKIKEETKKQLKIKDESTIKEIATLEKEYKEAGQKQENINEQYHEKLKVLNSSILEKQNDIDRLDQDISIVNNDKKDIDLNNKAEKEAYIKELLSSVPYCQLLKVDYASLDTLCSNGYFEILDDTNKNNLSALLTALNKKYDPQSTEDRVIPSTSTSLPVSTPPTTPAATEPAKPVETPTPPKADEAAKKEKEEAEAKKAEAKKETSSTDLFKLVCRSGCSQVSCGSSSSKDDDDEDDDKDKRKGRGKKAEDEEEIVLELVFNDKDKEALYKYSLDWKCDDEACSFGDSILKKEFFQNEEDLEVYVINKKDGEEVRSNSCTIEKSGKELAEEVYDPFLNNKQNGTIQQAPNTMPQNMNQYPLPNMSISVMVDVGFA